MSRLPERDTRAGRDATAASSGGRATPLIAVIFILIFTVGPYLAFTDHVPFTSYGYELNATFSNSANIATNSPVRIAGVDVGKVISTERDGDATTVTFTVDGTGRPIHDDAFAAIRPRIFLEGNFFVDLDPGSPSAPELDSGDTIPVSHTSTAVQIDEVLTALQSPVRADLSRLLESYGTALTHKPTAAEDVDPAARGARARPAPKRSTAPSTTAATPAATAPRSPTPCSAPSRGDLSRLVAGAGRTFGALASHEEDLQGLIVNFNVFTGALAAQSANLSTTIHRLAPTLQIAHSSLVSLNRTLPPLRTYAIELTPAVAELPGLIAAGETVARPGPAAALRQGGRRRRQAAAPNRPRASPAPRRRARRWRCRSSTGSASARPRSWSRPATRRSTTSSAPAGPTTASSSTRSPTSPARARTSTATAPIVRAQAGGGTVLVGEPNPRRQPRRTDKTATTPTRSQPPLGTQPQLGGQPPMKPEVRCYTQPGPRRQRPARPGRPAPPPCGGEPMSERNPKSSRWTHFRAWLARQARGHRKDTIAIVVLALAGIVMMLGIFTQQKASLPSGCRSSAKNSTTSPAEFATAQAVTPGQGQAVDIAGIQIGKVTSVDLEDGHAVVGMDIEPEVHGADPPRRDLPAAAENRTSTT